MRTIRWAALAVAAVFAGESARAAGAFKDGHQVSISISPADNVATGTPVTVIATCLCGESATRPTRHNLDWTGQSARLDETQRRGVTLRTWGPARAAGTYEFEAACGGATDSARLTVRAPREYRPGDGTSDRHMRVEGLGASAVGGLVFVGDVLTLHYVVKKDVDQYRLSRNGPWIDANDLGKYTFTLRIDNQNASFKPNTVDQDFEWTGQSTGNVPLYVRRAGPFEIYLSVSDVTPVHAPDTGSRKDNGPDSIPVARFLPAFEAPERFIPYGTAVDEASAPRNQEIEFTYEGRPRPAPFYQGLTVSETFSPYQNYRLTLGDFDEEWRRANPVKSQSVESILNSIHATGARSSFRIDQQNRFEDTHGGSGVLDIYPILPSIRNRATSVGFICPQRYKCGGRTYAEYKIYRAYRNGALLIWKTH